MASNETQHTQPYLTRRQKECLRLTANGLTARAISLELGISVRMVRWHLQQAREHLNAASSAQAVHKAVKIGLLE
jgi:DNA-binding CsgD family transcriptional regulator